MSFLLLKIWRATPQSAQMELLRSYALSKMHFQKVTPWWQQQPGFCNKAIIRIHISATRVKCNILCVYGCFKSLSSLFLFFDEHQLDLKKTRVQTTLGDIHPTWSGWRPGFWWHGTCISPAAETPPFFLGAECHCGNWRPSENVVLRLVRRCFFWVRKLIWMFFTIYHSICIRNFGEWALYLPYSPCKQRSKGEKPEAVIDTSYYIFPFTYTIITYILTSTIAY